MTRRDYSDAGHQQESHLPTPQEALVADSFSIDFCEHGYGRLLLFRERDKGAPFACAHLEPAMVFQLARQCAQAVVVEGHA